MPLALPAIRVGQPVNYEGLSVFPLFTQTEGGVDYLLSDEALADQSILITEVSEGGSVPELLVENKSDRRVLFLEGEELIGAKQNRVLNTSVLIAARSKIKVPVSCVEQGRWHYKSRFFGSSPSRVPSKLRYSLKASVSQSLREERGHVSDQRQVWRDVAMLHAEHHVASGTGAMSDAFETHQDKISSFKDQLKYVEGACGAAVAIGDRVISVDLFDKSSTCRKVWERLISGVVFDALEAKEKAKSISAGEVEQFLGSAGTLPWAKAAAVGEGEEYRATSPRGDHASVLTCQSVLVHGSVVSGTVS